jgi:hypothetical protein
MTNPASVPEAGGACHLMKTAVYSDGGDFEPAWTTSSGVGLSCYREKDARAPQEWALNWRRKSATRLAIRLPAHQKFATYEYSRDEKQRFV